MTYDEKLIQYRLEKYHRIDGFVIFVDRHWMELYYEDAIIASQTFRNLALAGVYVSNDWMRERIATVSIPLEWGSQFLDVLKTIHPNLKLYVFRYLEHTQRYYLQAVLQS